jgi:CubicO group peptidase (beta-lactamase class C family)
MRSAAVRSRIAAGLWLIAGTAGAADMVPGAAKRIDPYLDALGSSQLVNLTLAISEKGEIRYLRSIGFATIENGRPQPADEATRYRLGPVTMLLTASLFMQRAETASVTLDTPLAEFYPDIPNALDITYRDLLAHRSGLPNYLATPGFDSWRTQPATQAQLLNVIREAGTRFAPRERVEFSDTNYLLLGFVLEKLLAKSYDDIVKRQIADKLGLSRTYFAGTRSTMLESIAYRNTPSGWMPVAQTDPTVAGGAGGMLSTPAEITRVLDAMFGGKLVSAQSVATMRGEDGAAGFGLWPHEIAGQTGYGQAGSADGFSVVAWHFPSRGISIACASNGSTLPVSEIVDEVSRTLFLRGYRPPKPAITAE